MSALKDYEIRLNQVRKDGTKWLHTDVIKALKTLCTHWVFQLERGEENGLMHFQCSLRLRKKSTHSSLLADFKVSLNCDNSDAPQYIGPTVKGTHTTSHFNIDLYSAKVHTRVEGPWNSRDDANAKLVYIPKQFRGKKEILHPFQQTIFDSADKQPIDDPFFRIINVLIDFNGCIGKSVIAALCALLGNGIMLPSFNDAKELLQIMCDKCVALELRNPSPIMIDLPKSSDKRDMGGFYSAIEQIKNGYLCDPRYSFKEWWIDSPVIWVFTNEVPDTKYLSKDRWKLWQINDAKELVPYVEPADQDEFINLPNISRPYNLLDDINKVHESATINSVSLNITPRISRRSKRQ